MQQENSDKYFKAKFARVKKKNMPKSKMRIKKKKILGHSIP